MLQNLSKKLLSFFTIQEDSNKEPNTVIEEDIFVYDSKEDKSKEKIMDTESAYQRKSLMNKDEYKFYQKIKSLESDYNYIIVPKLSLSSVIDKKSKSKNELLKNVDFAIFSKDYQDLLLLIELKEPDEKIQNLCKKCDIEIIYFSIKNISHYSYSYLINKINTHIKKETVELLNTENIDSNKNEKVELL